VELFGEMIAPFHAFLTLSLLPQIENQKLVFKTQKIKIGDLDIPMFLAKNIVDTTLNAQLGKSLEGLPIILKRVNLEMGKLSIEFDFDQSRLPKINANVK